MAGTLQQSIREAIARVSRVFRREPGAGALARSRLAVRDQGLNRGAIGLAYGLLSIYEDLGGLVHDVRAGGRFDLQARCGLDPTALDRLNRPDADLVRVVRSILGSYRTDVERSRALLLEHIREINRRRLLGGETGGKMAYVRAVAGAPLRSIGPEEVERHLIELRRRTIVLLLRQRHRLEAEGRPTVAVQDMIDRVRSDVPGQTVRSHRIGNQFRDYPELAHRVKEMFLNFPKAFDPGGGDGIEPFCHTYTDELAQVLGDYRVTGSSLMPGLAFVSGRGVELAFARRDESYLTLGDAYGDCTARRIRRQSDPEVANIHWTVYPWLLDPFYRILEVSCDGDRALKAHLAPLIIRGRAVLMVDAIEAVPSLRDEVAGRPNPFLSERLWSRRSEILSALFAKAKELGHRMRAEAIYVDRFSNARWIREEIDRLPGLGYHIRQVESPFGIAPVHAMVTEILGRDAVTNDLRAEIQAVNLALMDQGLRPGFKEVGVLEGEEEDIPVRGP